MDGIRANTAKDGTEQNATVPLITVSEPNEPEAAQMDGDVAKMRSARKYKLSQLGE